MDETSPVPFREIVFDLKVKKALEREPITVVGARVWVMRVGDGRDGKCAVLRVRVRVCWEDDILWFENGAESDGTGVIIFIVGHGHKVGLDMVGGRFATFEAG